MGYIVQGNLSVDAELLAFVNDELLPAASLDPSTFWQGFDASVHKLAPRNAELLEARETLQAQIDTWLVENRAAGLDTDAYNAFLKEIGYLVPEGDDFVISTENVDDEIARIAGPQLVVPVMNARYALNAANARWGSLYDALYGTDVLDESNGAEKTGGYNPVRGAAVIAHARTLLDERAPLDNAAWDTVTGFTIAAGQLSVHTESGMTSLADNTQFAGFSGTADAPTSILLVKNGLHIDLILDKDGRIGSTDKAGINDIILESAISTIMDCEDSVAAVDGTDKVLAYQNWLGLMDGSLSIEMKKGDKNLYPCLAWGPGLYRPRWQQPELAWPLFNAGA